MKATKRLHFGQPALLSVLLALAGSTMAGNAAAGEYPAVLDWSGRVTLTLPVSGVLDNVVVQAGQTVRKGELLASIEPTLFKAGVAEVRADMDRLSEEQADAKRDLDRVQELYTRTVASTTELDAAKLRLARASSGLGAVQARVERARRLLVDAELRAPFDALVLQRHAEPGLVVTSQCQPAAVLTVARADQLIARARLTAAQAAGVRLGGEADVVLADALIKGKVQALVAEQDQRYSLEVALPRSADLLPGLSVNIRLP
jgi:RND family efflux transporter MFP subunit